MREKSINPLVELIYDAALDERHWAGLADKIAQTFTSTSTVVKTQNNNSAVQLMETTDNLIVAPQQQALADHWHANDVWVQRSVAVGMSRVITNRDLLLDSEFERLAFYHDWCRPLDIYHMVGAVFPLDNDTIGVLGVHRSRGASYFTQNDRRRVGEFLPHLQRALRMRDRLRSASLQHVTALDSLARLAGGVAVVDKCCRLLYANPSAEKTLQAGADLKIRNGRLFIDVAALDDRLQRSVREAVRTACGTLGEITGAIAITRGDCAPLTLLVTPLRITGLTTPAALIFIRDPQPAKNKNIARHLRSVPPSQIILRELFALTRTEAAIAAALAAGQLLEQIAANFNIGIGTVRSHLKSILAKTGTSRQGQLIALIGQSVAAIATSETLN